VVIKLTESHVLDRQELMTGPAPDGKSLWLLSGAVNVALQVFAGAEQATRKETYKLPLGPVFQGPVRATAIAWPSAVTTSQQGAWFVRAVEADFDDESGRVELAFEVEVRAQALGGSTGGQVVVYSVAYQVSIHGQPTG
jgi:hypothetical protein